MVAPLDLLGLLAGCFLGGIGRYTVSGAVARRIGETFPWGTMAVNVSGALLAGCLAGAGLLERETLRLALAAGFLGCYTTVSSLALQTLTLVRGGEAGRALANLALTLGFGLAACAFGFLAGGALR